jgi:hypothetical protein
LKQVHSKLPAATRYTETPTGSPNAPRSVLIAGVSRGAVFVRGVRVPAAGITVVSDDDAAWLAVHPHFVEHQQRGFVRIEDAA